MEIKELNSGHSEHRLCPHSRVNESMPVPPFIMCITAPRKAGKSNLILNMLSRKDMLKGMWDVRDIFVFCPTNDVNDDYAPIKANKINNFDNEIVKTIMDKQKKLIQKHGQSKVKPLLLIFDDCLSERKFATMNSAIEELAIKGRHILITVILTSQSLRRISRTIRLNSDYFIIFKFKNMTEYDAFSEEFINKKDRKDAIIKLRKVFETPYTFILVDSTTNDEKDRFRINFTESVSLAPDRI